MHVHDRLLLVFPREGTSMRVATEDESFTVTSEDGLTVPAGLLHADYWVTEVYDTFALLPAASLVREGAELAGLDTDAVDRDVRAFKRSRWLDALLAEYFEERVVRGARHGARHGSLELLVVLEVLRLANEGDEHVAKSARPGPSSVLARALRHIEANLFSDVDLEELCRVCGASRSSLLRHFKRELKTSPNAYMLGRRLDEARRLLERGTYGVGEVARLVGYESLGAFSDAFRRRFGRPPSKVAAKERGG
jgi:AraC-like DNA-binding protein